LSADVGRLCLLAVELGEDYDLVAGQDVVQIICCSVSSGADYLAVLAALVGRAFLLNGGSIR